MEIQNQNEVRLIIEQIERGTLTSRKFHIHLYFVFSKLISLSLRNDVVFIQ